MSKILLLQQRLDVLEANFNKEFSELKADIKNLDNPQNEKKRIIDRDNPMDWVKNWEDTCECAGIDPLKFVETWKNLDQDEFAYKQLKIIQKVITNNHIFDWNNSSEKKWIPIWDLSGSGFAFSGTDCNFWYTFTDVAARLYFRTESEAIFAAKTFIKIYEKYIKQ